MERTCWCPVSQEKYYLVTCSAGPFSIRDWNTWSRIRCIQEREDRNLPSQDSQLRVVPVTVASVWVRWNVTAWLDMVPPTFYWSAWWFPVTNSKCLYTISVASSGMRACARTARLVTRSARLRCPTLASCCYRNSIQWTFVLKSSWLMFDF